MPVRLSVEKPRWDVVDPVGLERVVLGRTAPLTVALCEPEKLERTRLRFHGIATESITNRFEVKLSALRNTSMVLTERLRVARTELGDTTITLGEAMEALSAQRDAALDRVAEMASAFARVNVDDASDRYRRSYALFARGAMDSALTLLDTLHLGRDYRTAQAEKAQGRQLIAKANTSIRQVHESYRLRSDASNISLDRSGTLTALQQMQAIQEENQDLFDDLDRAHLLRSIGILYRELARLPEAHAALQESMDLFRKHYGTDHVEMSTAWIALATLLEDEGEFRAAAALYDSSMSYRNAHPELGGRMLCEPMAGLGNALGELGEYDSASVMLLKVRDLFISVGGAGTRDEAQFLNNLGHLISLQGRYTEALDLYMQSLAAYERLSAAGVPGLDLSHVYANIGYVYGELGDYARALAYNDTCLVLEERMYGRMHTETAITLSNRAHIKSAQGRHADALVDYRAAYAFDSTLLGPDHFRVGLDHNSLANVLLDMGDAEGALAEFNEAARVIAGQLGENHPYTATILQNTAMLLDGMGRYAEAMENYRRALAIRKVHYGPVHGDVAESLSGIAIEWARMGQPDSCLWYCQGSLRTITTHLGNDHPRVANCEHNLASAYESLRDTAAAIGHYRQAYAIHRKARGPKDPAAVLTLSLAAQDALQLGRWDDARAWADTALAAAPATLAAWVRCRIAVHDGDPEAALEHAVKSLRLLQGAPDENKVKAAEVHKVLGPLAREQKRTDVLKEFGLEE